MMTLASLKNVNGNERDVSFWSTPSLQRCSMVVRIQRGAEVVNELHVTVMFFREVDDDQRYREAISVAKNI
jgi:hypothetical protein